MVLDVVVLLGRQLVDPAQPRFGGGDPGLVAQSGLVGLVGPQPQRPDQRREREALAHQGDQHGDERAEQQQVAVREGAAVVGGEWQREDRGQADHAARSRPAQDDDLAEPESSRGRARSASGGLAVFDGADLALELLLAEPGVQPLRK